MSHDLDPRASAHLCLGRRTCALEVAAREGCTPRPQLRFIVPTCLMVSPLWVMHVRPPAVVAVLRQQRATFFHAYAVQDFPPPGRLPCRGDSRPRRTRAGLSANPRDLIAVRVLAHAGLAARDGVGRLHVRALGSTYSPPGSRTPGRGAPCSTSTPGGRAGRGSGTRGRSRRSPATCSSSTEGSGAFRRRSPPTPLRCRNSAFPPPTSWGGWRGRTSFGEANFPTFWP